MMLEIISSDYGLGVATWVADRLVCSAPRTSRHDQTISTYCRTGTRHEKLSLAIHIMQTEIENPLAPSELAARIGISSRQLERLFSRYLDASPKRFYTKLRLENARYLLLQTNMKIIEVAVACGYTSQSHFSKVYRKSFGVSPHLERGLAIPEPCSVVEGLHS
jgi:transcriptional regulator GlxA family with amidase domain